MASVFANYSGARRVGFGEAIAEAIGAAPFANPVTFTFAAHAVDTKAVLAFVVHSAWESQPSSSRGTDTSVTPVCLAFVQRLAAAAVRTDLTIAALTIATKVIAAMLALAFAINFTSESEIQPGQLRGCNNVVLPDRPGIHIEY